MYFLLFFAVGSTLALEKRNIAASPNNKKYTAKPACVIRANIPYIRAAAPRSVIPVSYTHLDVYKRQCLNTLLDISLKRSCTIHWVKTMVNDIIFSCIR